jgi:hypothetical protein
VYNAIGNRRQKAQLLIDKRVDQSDGSIMELVVWKLPAPTLERPHGYKYRLNYSLPDGTTLVRYDCKTGKGDHKHLKEQEYLYEFTTPEQAIIDFINDVRAAGGSIS